jgi:hypothetical protein
MSSSSDLVAPFEGILNESLGDFHQLDALVDVGVSRVSAAASAPTPSSSPPLPVFDLETETAAAAGLVYIQSYSYVDVSQDSPDYVNDDKLSDNTLYVEDDAEDGKLPAGPSPPKKADDADDGKHPAEPSPPKKACSSESTVTHRSFSYTLQNTNKASRLYYCSHRQGSECQAKLCVPLEGGMPNLYLANVQGQHSWKCCVKNGVKTEGEGSYDWDGKDIGKENMPPAVIAFPDIKEDMRRSMIVLSTQNLTWTPVQIWEACRKGVDDKFPLGWSGLQKHVAIEIV